MKTKKGTKIAKSLFKNSLDSQGFVDPKKAHQILTGFSKEKGLGKIAILRSYKQLIENVLKKEVMVIESAAKVQNKQLEKDLIKKTGARKVTFQINPDIIIGARVSVGDWIYDQTLEEKLNQIKNQ